MSEQLSRLLFCCPEAPEGTYRHSMSRGFNRAGYYEWTAAFYTNDTNKPFVTSSGIVPLRFGRYKFEYSFPMQQEDV